MSESNCPNNTLTSLNPTVADNNYLSPNLCLNRGMWSAKFEVSNFDPLKPLNRFTFFESKYIYPKFDLANWFAQQVARFSETTN